ncbi:unnamed protein product [Tilletia controversa]|nr:unnamed protein product [Tilletia controversa]
MFRYRDGASRSASIVSAQHESQIDFTTYFGHGYHGETYSSTPDNHSQGHSGTASSSNHEEHPLDTDRIHAQTHSYRHALNSDLLRHQGFQQGRGSTLDPGSTTSSLAQAVRGAGYHVALGARNGRLSPRTGLQPLSNSTSVSINGTSYDIGGHHPDMSAFVEGPEDDDWLHEVNDSEKPRSGSMRCNSRGLLNVGFLLVVCISVLTLFLGWPVLYYANTLSNHALWGPKATALPEGPTWINVIDNNGSSQRTTQSPLRGLIDQDTPASAMNKTSSDGKRKMKLVFSDEFNEDGRTFFEGDDPYWTAVDLHYWGTHDFEWYSPLGAITQDGALRIKTQFPHPYRLYSFLRSQSAMLQSWNKLCIQGAVWMMGNIGRAGYGASNEGMWPATWQITTGHSCKRSIHSGCDVGTMPHQTYFANGTGGPLAAEVTGPYPESEGLGLSSLPGQRLSRCTCSASSDHPGPKHEDGSWMGRGASELDLLEGTSGGYGRNSMSFQNAPFNAYHQIASGFAQVFDPNNTMNSTQQSVSAIIKNSQTAWQLSGGDYGTYGVEWIPHYRDEDPYVTWMTDGQPSWRLDAGAVGPDDAAEIGQRLIPPEPVIIFNLGMSKGFSDVDFDNLKFPGVMSVDYVRFYQDEGMESLSCDGAFPEMPTVSYIDKYSEAYQNPNLTAWRGKRKNGSPECD